MAPRTGWILGSAVILLGAGLIIALLLQGARVSTPVPQPEGPPPTLAELPPSTLNLSVHVGLDQLPGLLEGTVPRSFGDLAERRGVSGLPGLQLAYAVEREPFEMAFRGDTVFLSTVLHYRARGWYAPPFLQEITGSCGTGDTPRPRMRLVLTSPLSIGENWELETELQVATLEPLTPEARDRCIVTSFQVDLTDWIVLAAEDLLEGWRGEVGEVVSGLDLRGAVARYWQHLEEPVAVGDGLWLTLAPGAVRMGKMEPTSQGATAARLELGLEVRPSLVTGNRPLPSSTELPPLARGEVEERSSLLVEARAGYGLLTELANAAFAGRVFEAAGRSVRVEEARVLPVGDGRIALELRVSGAVRGRLHLVGTPVFDPEREELRVPDLAFHVEARNVLARAAEWILRTRFADRIREEARWSVASLLRDSGVGGTGPLDRVLAEGIRLEGGIDTVAVERVAALPEAFVIRSRLDGTARLFVEGP